MIYQTPRTFILLTILYNYDIKLSSTIMGQCLNGTAIIGRYETRNDYLLFKNFQRSLFIRLNRTSLLLLFYAKIENVQHIILTIGF